MLYYDVFGIKAGGGSKPQRPISLQRQRPVFFRMLPSSVKIFGKYGRGRGLCSQISSLLWNIPNSNIRGEGKRVKFGDNFKNK